MAVLLCGSSHTPWRDRVLNLMGGSEPAKKKDHSEYDDGEDFEEDGEGLAEEQWRLISLITSYAIPGGDAPKYGSTQLSVRIARHSRMFLAGIHSLLNSLDPCQKHAGVTYEKYGHLIV